MAALRAVLHISLLLVAFGVRLDDDAGDMSSPDVPSPMSVQPASEEAEDAAAAADGEEGGYANGGVFKSMTAQFDQEIDKHKKEKVAREDDVVEAEEQKKLMKKKAGEAHEEQNRAWGVQMQEQRLQDDAEAEMRKAMLEKNKQIGLVNKWAKEAARLKTAADQDVGKAAAIIVKMSIYHVDYSALQADKKIEADFKTAVASAIAAHAAVKVKEIDIGMASGSVKIVAIINPEGEGGKQLTIDQLKHKIRKLEQAAPSKLPKSVSSACDGVKGIKGVSSGTVTVGGVVINLLQNVGKYRKAFHQTGCPNVGEVAAVGWWMTQEDQTAWANMLHLCQINQDGTANLRQRMECCGSSSGCKPKCKRLQEWPVDEAAIAAKRRKAYLDKAETALEHKRDAADEIEAQNRIISQQQKEIEKRKRTVAAAKIEVRKADWQEWIARTKAVNEVYSEAWAKKLEADAQAKIYIEMRKKAEAVEAMIDSDGTTAHRAQEAAKTLMNHLDGEVIRLQQQAAADEAAQQPRVDADQVEVNKRDDILQKALEAAKAKREAHNAAMNHGGRSQAEHRQNHKKGAAVQLCTTSGDYGSIVPAQTPCYIPPEDAKTFSCSKEGSKDFGPHGWCYTDQEQNKWGACSSGCSAKGKWVLAAKDTYCGPEVRKTLSSTKTGLIDHARQCMGLAANDAECGNQFYTNNENCVCVLDGKKCDNLVSDGMDLYSYVDIMDSLIAAHKADMEWEANHAKNLKEKLIAAEAKADRTISDFEARQAANALAVAKAIESRSQEKEKLDKAEDRAEKADAAIGKAEKDTDDDSAAEADERINSSYDSVHASYAAYESAEADHKLHHHLMGVAKKTFEESKAVMDLAAQAIQNDKNVIVQSNLTSRLRMGDQLSAANLGDLPWAYGYLQKRQAADELEKETEIKLQKDIVEHQKATVQKQKDEAQYGAEKQWVDNATAEIAYAKDWEGKAKSHTQELVLALAGQRQRVKDEKVQKLKKVIKELNVTSEEAKTHLEKAEEESEAFKMEAEGAAEMAAKTSKTSMKMARKMLEDAEDPKTKDMARNMLKQAKKLKAHYLNEEVNSMKMKKDRDNEAAEMRKEFNKATATEKVDKDRLHKTVQEWKATIHPPTAWPTPTPTPPPTRPKPTPLPTPEPTGDPTPDPTSGNVPAGFPTPAPTAATPEPTEPPTIGGDAAK